MNLSRYLGVLSASEANRIMTAAGYTRQKKYYPGMRVVNRIKVANNVSAIIYTYPVYRINRKTDVSYESGGSEYYDDGIEEKLGGDRLSLGQ